jgi:hypothetical protein
MRLRHTLPALLLLATLAVPALAARPVPTMTPLDGTVHAARIGTAARSTPACLLGVTGPAAWVVSYVLPPDDQYYTLIDTAECECGAGGVLVTSAHVQLGFEDDLANPIRVGIVAADLSNPACPVPIPGQYLCPPIDYDLVGPGLGMYDVSLPLSAACCVSGKAFLEITFVDWNEWWSNPPNLLLAAECAPCTSYNYYPGNDYDLCTFGFDGNPVMYVDAACCGVVPVRPGTWGALKSLYR